MATGISEDYRNDVLRQKRIVSPSNASADKIHKVSRSILGDLAQGVGRSCVFKSIAISVLAVGVLFLVMGLWAHGFTVPPPWEIAAVATGGLALGFFSQLPGKGLQKMQFEFSAIQRLRNKQNYNMIAEVSEKTENGVKKTGKLYLGAIPNRIKGEGEKLVNDEQIGAVLSVNEPWEREQLGLSLPYAPKDWHALDVHYQGIDAIDHEFLNNNQLDDAADFIHNRILEGKNVYVHCRAGCGRSAMAIAAYLIKYQGMEVKDVEQLIFKQRHVSTIKNKHSALKGYQTCLIAKQASTLPRFVDSWNES